MADDLPPAILLMGPTASGKTDLAIRLCSVLPCEIISVDSVMVYKGLNIGSAKPDVATQKRYPHHLLDINDPAEPYSAADFRGDALTLIKNITARKRIPLLVGGTMMYFNALVKGIANMPGADPNLRAKIAADAATRGWPALHRELMRMDPLAASRIHPNNRQRVQRALEVCLASGKRLSDYWELTDDNSGTRWQKRMADDLPCQLISLAIAPADRQSLASEISLRFSKMLDNGFVDEVHSLFTRGDLNAELPSIKAVGYRQVWQYLAGEISESEMKLKAEAATRQLAKRQMTWLKTWQALHWLPSDDAQLPAKALSIIVDQLQ